MRPPGVTVDSNCLLNSWSSRLSGSGPGYCSGACPPSAHKKLSGSDPPPAICIASSVFGEFSITSLFSWVLSAFNGPVSAECCSYTFIESEAEGFWGFKLKHGRVEPFHAVHRCRWRHISPLPACLPDDNDFAYPGLSCLEHTLDGTGNRAAKTITLHTFVDVSLSYSYTHLIDHPSQVRKRVESFVLACRCRSEFLEMNMRRKTFMPILAIPLRCCNCGA